MSDGKCSKCGALILNCDWPNGGGWAAMRRSYFRSRIQRSDPRASPST
jgi:hypothetical protein